MSELKQVLLSAVREAGSAILQLQQQGFSVTHKSNNDLLTQADLLANDILKKRLHDAALGYGWLSEESVDDTARLRCVRVWVVDPIDGTREYAEHIPEYAISVALVEDGQPIMACVFNPAQAELFFASLGEGAWLNDQRIQCDNTQTEKLSLLASRSEWKRGEWAQFAVQHDVKVIGSIAYKLALLAAGRAHATFSLGPKSEWDIAAGVLLVTEAGGMVTNQRGETFCFNQQQVLVDGIVATTTPTNARVFALLSQAGH